MNMMVRSDNARDLLDFARGGSKHDSHVQLWREHTWLAATRAEFAARTANVLAWMQQESAARKAARKS
jgi:hypothetical protein